MARRRRASVSGAGDLRRLMGRRVVRVLSNVSALDESGEGRAYLSAWLEQQTARERLAVEGLAAARGRLTVERLAVERLAREPPAVERLGIERERLAAAREHLALSLIHISDPTRPY